MELNGFSFWIQTRYHVRFEGIWYLQELSYLINKRHYTPLLAQYASELNCRIPFCWLKYISVDQMHVKYLFLNLTLMESRNIPKPFQLIMAKQDREG
jgi:hypothetical protein